MCDTNVIKLATTEAASNITLIGSQLYRAFDDKSTFSWLDDLFMIVAVPSLFITCIICMTFLFSVQNSPDSTCLPFSCLPTLLTLSCIQLCIVSLSIDRFSFRLDSLKAMELTSRRWKAHSEMEISEQVFSHTNI